MANEVRLIDANALDSKLDNLAKKYAAAGRVEVANDYSFVQTVLLVAPTIDPESLIPKGRWDWKHRHKGGFHKYTGVDEYGETHTITVDERFECDEPYCPNCGKWNESIYLSYCPNCGAKMEG